MICPRCNNTLAVATTKGVEIDHCPNCRGVWLDRGELDKIIERSNSYGSEQMGGFGHSNDHNKHYDKHHDNHQSYGTSGYGNHSNRKKSFFSELFDF